jgi:alginate O-acetyltransferase complex protein AlgI
MVASYYLFNRINRPELSKVGLIVGSVLFYSWWKLSYLPIIVSSIIVNYLIGLAIIKHVSRKRLSKSLLVVGILLLSLRLSSLV